MNVEERESKLGILPEDKGDRRVLVVDDDLAQRTMLVRMLRRAGYEGSTAMSNEEGRMLLKASAFGLVVVDLHMFAEDGVELVRDVSENHPGTYSLVVSGFATQDDRERLRRAGAFDLMMKPVDPKKFLTLVEDAFEARARGLAALRHRAG